MGYFEEDMDMVGHDHIAVDPVSVVIFHVVEPLVDQVGVFVGGEDVAPVQDGEG